MIQLCDLVGVSNDEIRLSPDVIGSIRKTDDDRSQKL